MKKGLCMVMAVATILGNIGINAKAVDLSTEVFTIQEETALAGMRALGTLDMSIGAKKKATSSKSFTLSSGDTVYILAEYTPKSANVDVGVVDPDGIFNYLSVSGGTINEYIQVEKGGNYKLAIRNNSSKAIQLSGTVEY